MRQARFKGNRGVYKCQTLGTLHLANENIKYLTRATDDYGPKVDKESALCNFISNLDKHIMHEVEEWKAARSKDDKIES